MIRLRVVRKIGGLSLRDYLRTPEAMFWTYGFPLVMALVLGVAFGEQAAQPSIIALAIDDPAVGAELRDALAGPGDDIELQELDADAAVRALALGRVDLVVSGTPAAPQFHLDPQRPGTELARLRVERALAAAIRGPSPVVPQVQQVDEPGGRYIDFLIPGLIGLNLLGAGIYGVGYNLTQMRVRNLLRRFAVTPIGRAEFLLGFLGSRLLLALPPPVVVAVFGMIAFGVPVRGSWFAVVVLFVAGAFAFSGLGLLIASRARTVETVSGLMNAAMMPMWLLGGAFFSNERFPELMQPVVQAIPLSWLNDGLRAAMLGTDGPGFVLQEIALLAGFGLVSFLAAFRIFRWT